MPNLGPPNLNMGGPKAPALAPEPTPGPPAKAVQAVKPQVLTHIIDGHVIKESSQPFPVSPTKSKSPIPHRVTTPPCTALCSWSHHVTLSTVTSPVTVTITRSPSPSPGPVGKNSPSLEGGAARDSDPPPPTAAAYRGQKHIQIPGGRNGSAPVQLVSVQYSSIYI